MLFSISSLKIVTSCTLLSVNVWESFAGKKEHTTMWTLSTFLSVDFDACMVSVCTVVHHESLFSLSQVSFLHVLHIFNQWDPSRILSILKIPLELLYMLGIMRMLTSLRLLNLCLFFHFNQFIFSIPTIGGKKLLHLNLSQSDLIISCIFY